MRRRTVLATALVLLVATGIAVAASPLTFEGHSTDGTTNSRNVVADGDYAYVADDDLVVFDVSDPTAPSRIASATLGDAYGLAVADDGDHLYVADNGNNEFLIYDVRDPTSPTKVANESATQATWVDVNGSKATVGYDGEQVDLYDVTDPTNPTLDDSIDIGGSGNNAAVQLRGDYAYVLVQKSSPTFRVYDVSGGSFSEVSTATTGLDDIGGGLAIDGSYAYLIDNENIGGANDDLVIYDISDPTSISHVSTTDMALDTSTGAVFPDARGDYLYVPEDGGDELSAVNVSDPESPSIEQTVSNGTPAGASIPAGTLYVVDKSSGGGLYVYDAPAVETSDDTGSSGGGGSSSSDDTYRQTFELESQTATIEPQTAELTAAYWTRDDKRISANPDEPLSTDLALGTADLDNTDADGAEFNFRNRSTVDLHDGSVYDLVVSDPSCGGWWRTSGFIGDEDAGDETLQPDASDLGELGVVVSCGGSEDLTPVDSPSPPATPTFPDPTLSINVVESAFDDCWAVHISYYDPSAETTEISYDFTADGEDYTDTITFDDPIAFFSDRIHQAKFDPDVNESDCDAGTGGAEPPEIGNGSLSFQFDDGAAGELNFDNAMFEPGGFAPPASDSGGLGPVAWAVPIGLGAWLFRGRLRGLGRRVADRLTERL